MADPLLSTLCNICHVKAHRYRCPRCSSLTCSLTCIKRHKQWAQCNGVRDPSVYIKRADLATPKGIDHDYNYLTSIEREIDHAERDASSRGVVLEENLNKNKNKQKGEVHLETAIEGCGVIITKAPKGMSRSKQNYTACTKKHRNLVWTVEWVQPDGRKTLGSCLETQPIGEAYARHMVCQDHLQPGKRKREEEEREDKAKSVRIRRKMEELGISSRLKEDPEDPKSKATNTHKQEPSSIIGVIDSSASDRAFAPTTTSIAPASASAATTSQPAPPISVAFCLHHPSLPSKHPVLITLSPDSTLATSLTNRLVLEFPTIYVLHRQPDGKLPEGFISEEDFFATTKKELIEEMVGGDQAISNMDVAGGGMRGELEDGEVDQRRLLEVFGKDLKEFGGSF